MSSPSQYQYAFTKSRPEGVWRWVISATIGPYAVTFVVRNIQTPYGPFGGLRNASEDIPLPLDIVQAMTDAAIQVQTSFTPTTQVLPSSLTFTVDEGYGESEPQSLSITNTGPFGSFLSPLLTPLDSFVLPIPLQGTTLSSGESSSPMVSVDSADLLAISSPYSTSLTVSDITATIVTVPVTINVRPLAEITLSTLLISATTTYLPGNTFTAIPVLTFTVTNTGPIGSILIYRVKKLIGLSDWLTGMDPQSGTLSSGSPEIISLTLTPYVGMMTGTYSETLRVFGYSSNKHVDVKIQLIVA